ncbi:hypothetical protein PV783_13945 [Chitinophaga sp. CC14]|uniref:hypothetical protein n=1 Tax=Chitinophaga sp. CC14 TaxID=3029199 RepID=UPI003B8015E5
MGKPMQVIKRVLWSSFPAVLIVAILQIYSQHKLNIANGFNRRISDSTLNMAISAKLASGHYYIAGLSADEIYLGNQDTSGLIRSFSYNLDRSWSRVLDVPPAIRFAWGAARIYYLRKKFILAEGITPLIFSFGLTGKATRTNTPNWKQFDLVVPSDSLFVCRTLDTFHHKNAITSQQVNTSENSSVDILKQQPGGIFSTDGMLLHDSTVGRFLYVYYYRNDLVSFDAGFEHVRTGFTIDTNTIAKIEISKIKSEHKRTFSSPPKSVNKFACVSDGRLFVYSGLRADNEKGKLSYMACPIDVYSVQSFKYLYSFYIPDYDHSGLHDMAIWKDKLVVLKGSHISVYSMGSNSIKESNIALSARVKTLQ